MQLSHCWKTYTGMVERASLALTCTHDLSGRQMDRTWERPGRYQIAGCKHARMQTMMGAKDATDDGCQTLPARHMFYLAGN